MPTIKSVSRPWHALGRRILGVVAPLLLSCAIVPTAHAQWAVHDADANTTLSTINDNTKGTNQDTTAIKQALGNTDAGGGKTVNANLDAINQKLFIGSADNSQPYKATQPGARVDNPDEALPASSSADAKLDDGSRCKDVAQAQQLTCQKIVAIQNSQYKYMLTMYENTKTRDDMLRELMKEREAITAKDVNQFGKLEDNTNKLTALYNLIALDQQQMATVNYAYEANLAWLRSSQAMLAKSAETGKPKDKWTEITLPGGDTVDLGPALGAVAAGAALKFALKDAQSAKPSGLQTLQIGESNGW